MTGVQTCALPIYAGVRVWYQTNNYSNIVFTTLKADNDFAATDNVCIEFYSSSTDLANGVYMIKDEYSTNTYNIYYDANTSIVNSAAIYGSQVYIPGGMNTINTISHSGLGIVANSVMEGIAYVSSYK